MVTEAHRFLHRQDPSSPALARHCVLQGFGVTDLVFHDMYYGCVPVLRSAELWALQEWTDDSNTPVAVIRLTSTGELDFSGNPDPVEAHRLFEAVPGRRPPRYGRRRSASDPAPDEGGAHGAEDDAGEAQAAGERAASAVSSSLGSGQGLVNRMNQIAAALEARHNARFFVIVDDLGAQFESLLSSGQAALHDQAHQVLRRRWMTVSNPTGALIMYLDPDRRLSKVIDAATPGVAWWEIGKPTGQEIGEALRRIDARVPLGLEVEGGPFKGVVHALERYADLRSALGNVARALQQDGRVTLNGVLDLPPVDLPAAERVLAELDELVGLDDLKAGLRGMVMSAVKRRRRLERDGVTSEETMHLIFLGSPGTGKTTVARIVARLFHAVGALPSDTIVETSADDIKSEYEGETRTNMTRLLRSALGGVLFLDEAHEFSDKEDRKSAEAVGALVKMAEDHRQELVIILAGYSAGISDLMRMNPGLPSRFPERQRFEFHDYNADQLWEVLCQGLDKRHLTLDKGVELPLRRLLAKRTSRGGSGNARDVRNLVDELQGLHDSRAADGDTILTMDDLPARFVRRDAELKEALDKLEGMTGIRAVKARIASLSDELAYAEREQEDLPTVPRFCFVGPPGTGKTTVGRLIAQLFYGMGLISRKKFVEAPGASLKASYLGQTATLVRKKFEEARGGVLFIDEAHGMLADDSFALDALRTLVSELTNPENADTVVIIAGYPGQIGRLLNDPREPGLERRFPNELIFEPFTPEDCVEAAHELLRRSRNTADDDFFAVLTAQARIAAQGPNFGNAGWVDNRVAEARRAMASRVMAHPDDYDSRTSRHLIAADLGAAEPIEAEPASAAPYGVRLNAFVDSVAYIRVVMAGEEEGHATGFAVTEDAVFVTNHHVIDGAEKIELFLSDARRSLAGKVIARDEPNDLALVKATIPEGMRPVPPLPLRSSSPADLPATDRELRAVGNAQVRPGEPPRVVTAEVTRNQEENPTHFDINGSVEEGFSGGPLWDAAQGGVVGVVQGGVGRYVKYAIRAENARALLESAGYGTESA